MSEGGAQSAARWQAVVTWLKTGVEGGSGGAAAVAAAAEEVQTP